MRRLGLAALLFGVAVLLFAAVVAWLAAPEISPEELLRRCEACKPEWLSYQEDIKGQIGARPVALWRGEPVSVRRTGSGWEVAFALSPPWSEYGAAVPVLLRDSLGGELIPESSRMEDGLRVYRYKSPPDAGGPWVELHYPHTERRIVLDAAGAWNRPE